jgi:hypothetical protein
VDLHLFVWLLGQSSCCTGCGEVPDICQPSAAVELGEDSSHEPGLLSSLVRIGRRVHSDHASHRKWCLDHRCWIRRSPPDVDGVARVPKVENLEAADVLVTKKVQGL